MRGHMQRSICTALVALFGVALAAPALAQAFLQYRCADGADLSIAFFEKDRHAFVQLDGKAMRMPWRPSLSGSRYKKNGIAIWIKGEDVRLKRPKEKWTQCKPA